MRNPTLAFFLLAACGNPTDHSARVDTARADDSDNPSDTTDADTEAPPDGCDALSWASGVYDVDHKGVARRVRVHVPAGHDGSRTAPLVLAFHGWGEDDTAFLSNASVTAAADERGYVVMAPEGLGSGPPDQAFNSWSFRGSSSGLDGDGLNPAVAGDTTAICDEDATGTYTYASCAGVAENTCSWTQCQDDDVAFAMALVALAQDRLCVDPDRVFAFGGSNGGMFTWELGQNPRSATKIRAIAPLIGLPHRGHADPPGKDGGMPVLLITGQNDRTVPPGAWNDASFTTTSDGDAYHYTSATAITDVWAAAAGCEVSAPAAAVDVGVSQLECRSHCAAEEGLPPVLDCRADMGHSYRLAWSWPLVLDFFDGVE